MRDQKFAALQLCILMAIVFFIQVFTSFDPGFQAGVSPWWKFFTSIFGHAGPEHIFNNLLFIALFGTLYESFTSSKTLLTTFLVSALGANITAFIFYTSSPIIGASGGAMGILAALAVYKPRKIGIALGVPAPMYAVLFSYLVINFAGLSATSNVAYEAHLFGIFTGFFYGYKLRNSKSTKEHSKNRDEDEKESKWKNRIREWEEKYML